MRLYVVRNSEGKFWDFGYDKFLEETDPDLQTPAISDANYADEIATVYGGKTIEYVRNPEKARDE